MNLACAVPLAKGSGMTTLHDLTVAAADGTPYPLAQHRGQVLLIVNTASRCGFTPQYEGLEALWRRHREAGLTVLGFPCNQFGAQEPGNAAEIERFCSLTYDVTFPVLAKVAVNGPGADPLYTHLTRARPGLLGTRAVKWNFTKFLVSRDGRVLARFAPGTKPAALEARIEAALAAPR
jgi:glutathione peroxidase